MQKGWAIADENGLYTGWQFTRAEAIANHISHFAEVSKFVSGRGLNDDQRGVWKLRRRRGDRAVKVAINIID